MSLFSPGPGTPFDYVFFFPECCEFRFFFEGNSRPPSRPSVQNPCWLEAFRLPAHLQNEDLMVLCRVMRVSAPAGGTPPPSLMMDETRILPPYLLPCSHTPPRAETTGVRKNTESRLFQAGPVPCLRKRCAKACPIGLRRDSRSEATFFPVKGP